MIHATDGQRTKKGRGLAPSGAPRLGVHPPNRHPRSLVQLVVAAAKAPASAESNGYPINSLCSAPLASISCTLLRFLCNGLLEAKARSKTHVLFAGGEVELNRGWGLPWGTCSLWPGWTNHHDPTWGRLRHPGPVAGVA